MVESAGDTVSLLVCLGERKRPIFIEQRNDVKLRLEIVEAFRDVFGIYMSQTTLALLLKTFVYTMHHGRAFSKPPMH